MTPNGVDLSFFFLFSASQQAMWQLCAGAMLCDGCESISA